MIKPIWKYPIILLIISFTLSCNKIVSEEEVLTLIDLSYSENVIVNKKGSDLIIEIFNSDLEKTQREVYYTTIALFAFENANKNRNTLFMNGKSIINFIDSNQTIDSYSIENSEMFKIKKIYNSLIVILESICENDLEKIYSLIDDEFLKEAERKEIADVLLGNKLCENLDEYIIYSFRKDNHNGMVMASLTVHIEYSKGEDRNIDFNFSSESKKLVGAEEL